MEAAGSWSRQMAANALQSHAREDSQGTVVHHRPQQTIPVVKKENEDEYQLPERDLAKDARAEALRLALNKLAEDSGSDMDTDESSDDSLSSADSEKAGRGFRNSTGQTSSESGSSSSSESEEESEEEPLAKRVAKPRLRWTSNAKSKLLRSIDSQRDQIFAKQRSLRDSPLQAISDDLVDAEIRSLPIPGNAHRAVYTYEHIRYLKFAKAAQLPPYPITYPLIALYLSYYGTVNQGTLGSQRSWLNRLYRVLKSAWDNDATYQELEAMGAGEAEEAIRDYIRERSNSRIRPPKAKAAEKAQSQPEADSSSEEDSTNNYSLSRKRHQVSDDESEASASDGDDESEESTGEELQYRSQRQMGRQQVTPGRTTVAGIPVVDQTFDSAIEAYQLCCRLTVLALGTNVTLLGTGKQTHTISCARRHSRYSDRPGGCCEFRIRLELIGNRWTVTDDSVWEHNHGETAERLADPNWLPTVKNAHARQALGLEPLEEMPHKKQKNDMKEQRRAKELKRERRKREKESEREVQRQQAESSARPNLPPTISAQQQHHQYYPDPTPAVTYRQPLPPSRPLPTPSHSYDRNVILSRPLSSTSAGAAPSYPSPAIASGPRLASQPQNDSFLSTLSVLLSSLHPSLSSLAQPIFDHGIKTVADFESFVCLEPSILQRSLDGMRKTHQISIIHAKLLLKHLASAQESGFSI